MDKLLTIKDIQTIFGCGKDKAYQIVTKRGFPSIKIGRVYYISEKNLQKWIENNFGNTVYIK